MTPYGIVPTAEELATLRRMHGAGTFIKNIAHELGWTVPVTRYHIRKLGLPNRRTNGVKRKYEFRIQTDLNTYNRARAYAKQHNTSLSRAIERLVRLQLFGG